MLTNLETELLKYVAHDPFGIPRHLISPDCNMSPRWFQSPLALRIFSAIAKDALMDKPTSAVSIMLQSGVSAEEKKYFLTVWNSGKALDDNSVDVSSVTTALHNDAIQRDVAQAWKDYQSKIKAKPEFTLDYINELGAQLSTISYEGVAYNPDPTAHYDDLDVEVGTSWGSGFLDLLYGGVPNMGYGLFVAPTGYGKSSFARSVTVYSILRSIMGERTDVLLAVNELKAGVTSRGIRDAMRDVFRHDEYTHDDIDRFIRRYSKLYEDCYSYSRFEQMLHWHRPNIAIIDSLDALGYPPGTEKLDEADKHQARAIGLNDMSAKYGCFVIVPANASGANQILLKQGNLAKIYDAAAFGSAWYQNKSTYATVMTWDKDNPGMSIAKNTKNRPNGQKGVGNVITLAHSDSGHYYRDAIEVDLN